MRARGAWRSARPGPSTPARCWPGARAAARIRAASGHSGAAFARWLLIGLAVFAAAAGPAHAGTSGTIAAATQDIYRGDQASEGDPVVTLGVHHETVTGFYLGGTVTGAADEHQVRLASGSQYAGYAFAAGTSTLEVGVIHRTYRKAYSDEYEPDFTEAYLGISHGGLTGRVFLSPGYVPGRFSVYTSADAEVYARRGWSVSGHAGLRLTTTKGPPVLTETTKLDWALRLDKTIGTIGLGVTVSGVVTKEVVETPRVAAGVQFAF